MTASGSVTKASARIAVVGASVTAIVLACGPFMTTLETVTPSGPADNVRYFQGELGVVRPRFSHEYLVEAYRVLTGKKPAAEETRDTVANDSASPYNDWVAERDAALGGPPPGPAGMDSATRSIGNYQQIDNCTEDAFANAVRTIRARAQRFGRSSAEVADWTRAQVAVFRNCPDGPLALPEPASAGADPIVRADRDYQTAAAYFYAMEYDEAARRFRAIADDRSSPWRPQGRYLAARAMIRRATVPENEPDVVTRFLTGAESELQAVLGDTEVSAMHGPARRLLGFVDARLHPIERLHAVSKALTATASPAEQDITDYGVLLHRRFAGSNSSYADLSRDDDLTAWVLAVQGSKEGQAYAVAQWQRTQSAHWLIAALWHLSETDAAVASVLDAAQRIDRTSPAYATVSFLRVRLLARAGRAPEAVALLATLPDKPQPGFPVETINLLKAERLMLARTLDEVLANAPRGIVVRWTDPVPNGRTHPVPNEAQPVTFDEDAATIFNQFLPLDRLVEASRKATLPDRLRRRVAVAAFSRALLLGRHSAAVAVAPTLRRLAPQVRNDIDLYVRAAPEDRRAAGLLLLLRTPGMRITVSGPDDDFSYRVAEPVRTFDHLLRRTWWCGTEMSATINRDEASETISLLYPARQVPYPAFLTDAERAAVERESQALTAIGPARSYLAQETIKWARANPAAAGAAEALALVVEGWRWNCGDNDKWQLAREAFGLLHRQYPESEWAKKTRYWYR